MQRVHINIGDISNTALHRHLLPVHRRFHTVSRNTARRSLSGIYRNPVVRPSLPLFTSRNLHTERSSFRKAATPLSRTRTTQIRTIAIPSLAGLPFLGRFFSSSTPRTGISSEDSNMASEDSFAVEKTDQEWRAVLSREQFRILRQKGTEAPHSGEYDKSFKTGTYNCAACDNPLYTSTTKFKSGCGWPAFFEGIPGAIKRNEDKTFGMMRTEIVCAKCGGHLGHVFKGEGYDTPTDERHCVNSVSLKLKEEKK
ncbi:Thioredoxin [Orbilia brochopaga]|nr:Thioredoxin [Drechslerella brochopaga]